MPTLMLRGVPGDLLARLRAYARQREISTLEAATDLLTRGLDGYAARSASAASLNDRPAAERSEAGRKAVQARWAKVREER